jgi:4-hydroxy 2-oxovalerate aldolase
MYRPEIKVVDCTIRDGGLINNSKFDLDIVRTVYKTACDAGIDYVELGYRNSDKMFSRDKFGPWRFCDEKDLRAATEGIDKKETKVAVMQDAHKAFAEDVLPADESVIDMIRVATYVKDVDKAIALANNATDKGYECTLNVMAISTEGGMFLEEALHQMEEETQAKAVYVVDSFGSLYSEQVHYLVELFRKFIKTKEIGVHMHNNQQLAYANTIEGIIKDANYVDGTLLGMGRGPGNCPLELLIGFLKNPKYRIFPILQGIADAMIPLSKKYVWGYHVPYMLTGMMNLHPNAAIEWMADEETTDISAFYTELVENIS